MHRVVPCRLWGFQYSRRYHTSIVQPAHVFDDLCLQTGACIALTWERGTRALSKGWKGVCFVNVGFEVLWQQVLDRIQIRYSRIPWMSILVSSVPTRGRRNSSAIMVQRQKSAAVQEYLTTTLVKTLLQEFQSMCITGTLRQWVMKSIQIRRERSSPILICGCPWNWTFFAPGYKRHQGYRVVPYRLWRFCATSERPRRSKAKLVLQWFCPLLISLGKL